MQLSVQLVRLRKTKDQTFHIIWYKDALLGVFGPQSDLDLKWFELRCLEYVHLVIFIWCPVSLHKLLCSGH